VRQFGPPLHRGPESIGWPAQRHRNDQQEQDASVRRQVD
jgi:hypothetical protein